MKAIRIESGGASDLAHAYEWLSRHRGQVIELDRTRQVELGVPITGARAVLVAVTLQSHLDGVPLPELGGVMRVIASRWEGEPVRLVFEGRSPVHLPPADAEATASELLAGISELIAEDDRIAEVA